MRGLVLFLAGALCLLGLAGCSSRVLNLDELGALAEERDTRRRTSWGSWTGNARTA